MLSSTLEKTNKQFQCQMCGCTSNLKTVFFYITGKATQLFTSVLYNNYSPPPGFCFDVLCDDDPFIDDKHSPDYNVNKLVCLNCIIWQLKRGFVNMDIFMWYHVNFVCEQNAIAKPVNCNASGIEVCRLCPDTGKFLLYKQYFADNGWRFHIPGSSHVV